MLLARYIPLLITFIGLSAPDLGAQEKDKPTRHLYILSGQSNMTGALGGSFRSCVEQSLGRDKVLVVQVVRPGRHGRSQACGRRFESRIYMIP